MNIGKRPLIVLFCVCFAFSLFVASMSGCAKKASAAVVQDVICVDGQCGDAGVMQRSVSVNRNRVMRSRPIFKRRMIVVDGYQGSSEVVEAVENVEEVPAAEVVVSEMPVNTYERTVEIKVRRRLFKRRGFLFRRCR
jgi:ribulose 1,5-bisphosphate synthetase/thiazole synthase